MLHNLQTTSIRRCVAQVSSLNLAAGVNDRGKQKEKGSRKKKRNSMSRVLRKDQVD